MDRTKDHAKLARLALLLAFSVGLASCGRSFYMSESDARSYQDVLSGAEMANELFSDLQNQQIEIQFDSSGPVPQISHTNLLQTVRALQDIAVGEEHGWVHLDRLSAQLEQLLTAWVNDRLTLLSDAGGSSIKLESLKSATVRFVTAPSFAYDADQQSISFDTRVAVGIHGTINVNLVGDLESLALNVGHDITFGLLSGSPNGRYPLSISIDLPLNVQFHFLNPYSDAASVRIHITPTPGNVSVAGDGQDLDSNVANLIQNLITQQLSPVDETIVLGYDNFTLSGVRVSPAGSELGVTYHSRPQSAEPLLDLVARGPDGNLYHARKRNGVWGDFTGIALNNRDDPRHRPVQVASDPAVVASGPDQLDLVAVASDGDLFYIGWREGAWGNVFRSRLPLSDPRDTYVYQSSRPVLVASAPGQLEVITVDTDGDLWHLRRLNGQWQAPALVDTPDAAFPPFHDLVAVRSGGQIVLFYLDGDNRLFSAVYDLGTSTWGRGEVTHEEELGLRHGTEIPTSNGVAFTPATAACGDGRVDLVYAAPDGTPYHRVFSLYNGTQGMNYSDETTIGGTLSAPPVLTCSGFQQLELFGRGTDNLFYYNHFAGPASPQGAIGGQNAGAGWQGWVSVTDPFFGNVFDGQIGPSVALASTRTGEVQAVVSQNGSGAGLLLYNSFDSKRFGATPWKAVHWRGFEPIGAMNLLGSPALALSDRQLEIGIVGNDTGVWRASLADDNLARFAEVSGSAVRSGTDPAVLSSGPGIVEVLVLSPAAGLQHMRRLNGLQVQTNTPLPSSSGIVSPIAATSSGAGQIEVVAVAADGTLHHWRRVNGTWLDPTTISGTVISAPILVDTGAGQLELLAIGGDHKLYRWRFTNGQWTTWTQIQSDLRLSSTLFGQRAAASWGDGTADVVVVEDGTGRMFHTRILPPLPPSAGPPIFTLPYENRNPVLTEIGGSTIDIPALAAFSYGRLVLLALGTDHYPYENWTGNLPLLSVPPPSVHELMARDIRLGPNTLHWRGFVPLAGTPVQLGGVARLGDRELAALLTDPNGRVYLNRFLGWRWAGFLPLPGQPPQLQSIPTSRAVLTVH